MSFVCICVLKLDETLMERLWGLTEMFPDTVRTAAEVSAQCSVSLAKKFYRYLASVFFRHSLLLHTIIHCALVSPVDKEINASGCSLVSVFPGLRSGWVLPPS